MLVIGALEIAVKKAPIPTKAKVEGFKSRKGNNEFKLFPNIAPSKAPRIKDGANIPPGTPLPQATKVRIYLNKNINGIIHQI